MSFIKWEMTSEYPITSKDAMEYQKQKGYHPAGYDFFAFKCVETTEGFKATWLSSDNCD